MPTPAKTWLLTSEKIGDTAQTRLIADAWAENSPGCEVTEVEIAMREAFRFGKPTMRASLHHVEPASADRLQPPWPELAIGAGRRLAMVLLWLKERSGGRTKIIYLGRPQRHMSRFDLVIAPSQYRVPSAANLLRLSYPLARIDQSALEDAAERWREDLGRLAKPLIVLLVGGPQRVVRFDTELARHLLTETAAIVEAQGGSLYVSTSRRTPPAIVEALAADLPACGKLHRWSPDGGDNPYLGLLAHGDGFVVTGDSISMLVEVAGLGRPLAIYRQPPPSSPWRRGLQAAARAMDEERGWPILRGLGRQIYRLGLASYPRDYSALHERLIAEGYAVPLGQPFPPGGKALPSELPRVVERIQAVFQDANE